ncbi:hypothetical protein Nepgr_001711 [Nepenthes gracilis]|uniref:Uncharacterized protein n=1 Tax=Nepenthes gracilis TaxID=150966 RepID=A0AAD3P8W9_NEPGR|nr:hypothetical protein Nepgr_001711 [Nepenthes gracilis]
MVPLADLFNHKTGTEDVHFTFASSAGESEDDTENTTNCSDGELQTESSFFTDDRSISAVIGKTSLDRADFGYPQDVKENSTVLEMIIVKDVKAGVEVFNTYGLMGNAALLHRYGFTEIDNPYDIVNIDLDLVVQWSSATFSGRFTRSRLSLWRRLSYAGCVSQNSEYFEISFDGEPQIELLILLHIISLTEDAYTELNLAVSVAENSKESLIYNSLKKSNGMLLSSDGILLSKGVRRALLSLADMRESLYGLSSLDDDIEKLRNSCCIRERKLYHSLTLRVSERRILNRLRTWSAGIARRVAFSKKLKR